MYSSLGLVEQILNERNQDAGIEVNYYWPVVAEHGKALLGGGGGGGGEM